MDKIYLVAPGHYLDEVADGFATTEDEIKQIIRGAQRWTLCGSERIEDVTVDLAAGAATAFITDNYDDYQTERHYVIHEILRVGTDEKQNF
jgi:hypothetical protein